MAGTVKTCTCANCVTRRVRSYIPLQIIVSYLSNNIPWVIAWNIHHCNKFQTASTEKHHKIKSIHGGSSKIIVSFFFSCKFRVLHSACFFLLLSMKAVPTAFRQNTRWCDVFLLYVISKLLQTHTHGTSLWYTSCCVLHWAGWRNSATASSGTCCWHKHGRMVDAVKPRIQLRKSTLDYYAGMC
jgi:hypothetical protein